MQTILMHEHKAGVTFGWADDGQIFITRAVTSNRQTVDAWVGLVREVVRGWPLERPFLAVHDSRGSGVTPYNQVALLNLAASFPEAMYGRYAIIISHGLLGYGIRAFASGAIDRLLPNLESAFYFNYGDALAWLKTPVRD